LEEIFMVLPAYEAAITHVGERDRDRRHRFPNRVAKLIIEPGLLTTNYWRDLWRYRELLCFLTWRDVVVRYKQTVIGVAWALIRPALTMLVFVAFRRFVGIKPGGPPEPLLVFVAVLPWQLFSTALSDAAASLIGNAHLISKVYFPRLIVPSAAALAALVDFFITLALLATLMLWYGVAPGWHILLLPPFVLLAFSLSLGMGFLFAALNVQYRDFRYIVPFIVQFGLFISPIAYTTAGIPERWQTLYSLNPMAGIIDGFRWSLLGGQPPLDLQVTAASVALTAASLILGGWYFRRTERRFADVI
jgi:lipopolysaccharide transport system permease protein